MFTPLVFSKSSAGGREWGGKATGRDLVSDEGMLKTRRVHSVASRVAIESGGGSVLCPIPSFLLFRSDLYRFACPCACMRVYCVSVCFFLCTYLCVWVRLLVSTYRRLLATLLRRTHRLTGTRRTCPHQRVLPDSTGCPGKNLSDSKNP